MSEWKKVSFLSHCAIPSVRLRNHLTILVQLMSSADQQYTDLTNNCSCVPRQYGELFHQHREGVPEWMEWYVHYGQLTKRQLVVPMVKDRIPCGIGRWEQLRHSDRLCFAIDTEILSLGLLRAVKCPTKVNANWIRVSALYGLRMVEWHDRQSAMRLEHRSSVFFPVSNTERIISRSMHCPLISMPSQYERFQ